MSDFTATHRALYQALDVPRVDWKKPSGKLIAFAHSLVVPAGKHVNRPLRLKPFQLKFVRAIYNDQIDGTRAVRQALLSVARRNGKTLIASVILLAHLAGPFRKPNSTIVSAATTRKQAGIVFRFIRDIVRVNPLLRKQLEVLEGTKRIVYRADKSYYEALAAEAGANFGLGLDLAIYDELGNAKTRDLYNALMTSLGSQPEPLMVIISTQAASDQHLLSELIDYGDKLDQGIIKDRSFVSHVYTVPTTADIRDEKSWKIANPALGDYRDLREMREAIARAVAIPGQENTVRQFYLNQRVRAENPFLSPSVFDRCNGPVDEDLFRSGRSVYGGLDLSARADLTAAVYAVEDDEQNVHLLPRVWTPENSIDERSKRDRAPYDVWSKQGLLLAVPGETIDYDWVAQTLADDAAAFNIVRLNFDPWRIAILKQALARIGAYVPLEELGQNFKGISPCVEAFEALALAGKIRHGGNPIVRWCFANAVVARDPQGNRKLDKSKAYGRIDVAVSAIMAVGAMKSGEVEVAALVA